MLRASLVIFGSAVIFGTAVGTPAIEAVGVNIKCGSHPLNPASHSARPHESPQPRHQ